MNVCMTHERMYVCMHACMYVCMYVCTHERMYVCTHERMYVCTHERMYVCMYACMHLCMYVCMYVYYCLKVIFELGSGKCLCYEAKVFLLLCFSFSNNSPSQPPSIPSANNQLLFYHLFVSDSSILEISEEKCL